eukprot:scaffold321218_cov32-Tisochrysis_lutea.AAC.3
MEHGYLHGPWSASRSPHARSMHLVPPLMFRPIVGKCKRCKGTERVLVVGQYQRGGEHWNRTPQLPHDDLHASGHGDGEFSRR